MTDAFHQVTSSEVLLTVNTLTLTLYFPVISGICNCSYFVLNKPELHYTGFIIALNSMPVYLVPVCYTEEGFPERNEKKVESPRWTLTVIQSVYPCVELMSDCNEEEKLHQVVAVTTGDYPENG